MSVNCHISSETGMGEGERGWEKGKQIGEERGGLAWVPGGFGQAKARRVFSQHNNQQVFHHFKMFKWYQMVHFEIKLKIQFIELKMMVTVLTTLRIIRCVLKTNKLTTL